ncbi:MAG: putative TonB-dependent receptor [Bacteroidetes bacterium]|nr:putative TonB-dependent receptor [Bacteroidota bacterium]
MKLFSNFRFLLPAMFVLLAYPVVAQTVVQGRITDKKYKEPLTGAAIMVEGTTNGTTADIDGNYTLNVAPGKYTIVVSYVSYTMQKIPGVVVVKGKPTVLNIELEEAALVLESVQVVGQRRTDTELSMLNSVRTAVQVVNGISSQQISKTLDRDASEVVKRVPGVTIQDNRFVVVRGLNQRYNNVWLNNAATPSSETDVKAFSFDAIPSSMIDNMMIYKTGSPELSSEATGGFIKIFTKNIPDENFLTVEYGAAYNDVTTFKDTYHLPSHSLDFLGLGSASRNLPSGFPADLSSVSLANRDAYALKLSTNWAAQRYTALPNQKASVAFGKKWSLDGGAKIGTITSLTYSNSYSTRSNMQNDMYEKYDADLDIPIYMYDYNTSVYSNEFKVGLMHNWAYQGTNGTKIEFKNILNQIGVDKSAVTEGWNNYRQGNFRYYSNQYSSRTTYSGQLSGNHKIKNSDDQKLDWNVGYAYANRIEPDRQNWSMKENSISGVYEYMLPDVPSINELGRLYMTNHEHVATAALNYEQKLLIGSLLPTLKAGAYGEFKTRNFNERSICYRKAYGPLTDDEVNALDFETLFTEPYLGQNKVISVDEQTNVANTYEAKNVLGAGYVSLNIPVGAFNINGGVRAEYNRLLLDGYYNISSPVHKDDQTVNFFPSLNTSFNIDKKTLFRLAYAHTINRPEFREVSPLNYYDFTEKNSVSGNPDLKDAKIQNVDLRFEHYPTPGETFTLAAFYKHFTNPIEMVSVGVGNEFSFENAKGAVNYGLEVEAKKSLAFIGLENLSLSLNASYIFSEVQFDNTQTQRSRALQGQSPYVVNMALFYQSEKLGLSSSLMYNVMGKRIMVAAQLNHGEVVIPDIYEMPRHVVDFTLNKKVGKRLELKFGVKDLLAQDYVTQQVYDYVKDGETRSATLKNRVYNLGRTWSVGASYKF